MPEIVFKVGDRVRVVTRDTFNGERGVIAEIYDDHRHVIIDFDAARFDVDKKPVFRSSEVRKLDAIDLLGQLTDDE